ncbi:MAG TPA: phosphatase PAP2 family protein [Puia sp.]|uniref:phosphatase PAP2 family protein n=1 Tax=Puia sp. TaxID=2045100 RepID=UPI002B6F6D3A|nr:phosphatase PAP2 family protein [Puia sp.]HVU93709.1 phosphatase PAP2 family protein [Puia sp.]
MKHLSFVLALTGCSLFSNGQMTGPSAFSRALTPARGHYKTLAALSPKPGFSSRDLDSVQWPLDKKFEKEVLSDKPAYLLNQNLDDFQLPAPPANSSEQTHAELNYLLELQKTRTPEDIRSSLYMSNVFETPSDAGRSIGCWAAPQHLPLLDSLFSHIIHDADFFLWLIKFKWCRPRPYMLDSRIRDLEPSRAASYPSGHVVYAYIHAYIYQELAPDFTDVFIAKADAMAHARQIIGVHYPSDCEVSRIFARQFVTKLFQNDQFLREFAAVKKEWVSHSGRAL